MVWALLVVAMVANQSFTLKTVDGKAIHIEVKKNGISVKEYPNKVIILDFFGKHCPPCRMEIPILGDLQKKLQDRLQIIGLHVQEPLSKEDIAELKRRGINYPVIDYATSRSSQEFVELLGRLTGWGGSIPYMLFFDNKGIYAGSHLGMAMEESLEKFVADIYHPVISVSSASRSATISSSSSSSKTPASAHSSSSSVISADSNTSVSSQKE